MDQHRERRQFLQRVGWGMTGLAAGAALSPGEAVAAEPAAAGCPGWRSVRDFGAAGDGRHDDTDALQRAINAASMVFFPKGTYRTTRPLVLRPSVWLLGDREVAEIRSSAESCLVCREGPDQVVAAPDAKHPSVGGVRLEQLHLHGDSFGLHTRGAFAGGAWEINRCHFSGTKKWGMAVTGFFMGMAARITNCHFAPGLYVRTEEGARFNTISLSNCCLYGAPAFPDYRLRLEGCIQCVEIANLCLESCNHGGVYLDARFAGVNIDLRNIWNYDARRGADCIRVEAGRCININNVLAADHPTRIVLSGAVENVFLNNVSGALEIDARGARNVVAFNSGPVKNAGPGSILDGVPVKGPGTN